MKYFSVFETLAAKYEKVFFWSVLISGKQREIINYRLSTMSCHPVYFSLFRRWGALAGSSGESRKPKVGGVH